jgi:hypothetical protein
MAPHPDGGGRLVPVTESAARALPAALPMLLGYPLLALLP